MQEKEKEKNIKLMTYDLFHITILKLLGYKTENIIVAEGFKPKVLVTFIADKKMPALSEINIEYNGKKISLMDFSIHFRETKKNIFKKVDKGERDAKKIKTN